MNEDPVVQILREAAARGRQLRLARDQSVQDQERLDDGTSQAQSSDPTITTSTMSSEHTDSVA
jgi:hypothetical protein